MFILAIDTSCDETSVAVTQGVRVISNVVSSQVRYHKKFGGVVPFLAQRLHSERIASVVKLALQRAKVSVAHIDAIAVTYGPGLAPALQVGIEYAKKSAQEENKPLYAVDHMAGHMAACLAQVGNRQLPAVHYPLLAVLVSGGHSELVRVNSWGNWSVIGQTVDDALGEAYDKVAKMLGLGYPGGKLVSKLAESGNENAYSLPVAMLRSGNLNLSFSGLKNAVRLLIESLGKEPSRQQIIDVCASFEQVAQKSLVLKVEAALQSESYGTVLLAGGVAANNALRHKMRTLCAEYGVTLRLPTNKTLCTDNAAMIGVAAYLGICSGQQPTSIKLLDRIPGLTLGEQPAWSGY